MQNLWGHFLLFFTLTWPSHHVDATNMAFSSRGCNQHGRLITWMQPHGCNHMAVSSRGCNRMAVSSRGCNQHGPLITWMQPTWPSHHVDATNMAVSSRGCNHMAVSSRGYKPRIGVTINDIGGVLLWIRSRTSAFNGGKRQTVHSFTVIPRLILRITRSRDT